MRIHAFIGLMFVVLSVFAQEPKSHATPPELPKLSIPQAGPALAAPVQPRCSIPLVPMQIPKDTDFKLKQIQPKLQALAPMPEGKPPAPPCNPSLPIVPPAK